jgi:5-formyltetrahydrofolate cyclo-ligase
MDKVTLRKQFRPLRDSNNGLGNADKIIAKLKEISENYQIIFCYVSIGSEVPTHQYIKDMIKSGKTVCVPKVVGEQMLAIKINFFEELSPGEFGILSPKSGIDIDKNKIDLAVTPLLAFNNNHRLGTGGGYYDKFLQDCRAYKIGLAYEFQRTPVNFAESHDIKMDRILTD